MSEHTKGPWNWVDMPSVREIFHGCSAIFSVHIDDAIIATIAEDVPGHEANARLIAAAPELLEALVGLRNFMWSEGYADQNIPMAKADAAIAKAEETDTLSVTAPTR